LIDVIIDKQIYRAGLTNCLVDISPVNYGLVNKTHASKNKNNWLLQDSILIQ